MRIEIRAEAAEDTRAVGDAVASLLKAGDVVALTGELGAGKTTFAQGAARGLGVAEPVVSPTFTLAREYRGRLPLHHVDIYRLERLQDVVELGLDEMVEGDGVVLIEWGDAVEALLPEDHLTVEITMAESEEARSIVITGAGPSWAARWEHLEGVTARPGRVA